MTKNEFKQAVTLSRTIDMNAVDDSVLHGLALGAFKRVTATIEVCAVFIRWHCIQLNGVIDSEALNEMATLMRRKVTIA